MCLAKVYFATYAAQRLMGENSLQWAIEKTRKTHLGPLLDCHNNERAHARVKESVRMHGACMCTLGFVRRRRALGFVRIASAFVTSTKARPL